MVLNVALIDAEINRYPGGPCTSAVSGAELPKSPSGSVEQPQKTKKERQSVPLKKRPIRQSNEPSLAIALTQS